MGKYYIMCAGFILVGCASGSDVPEDVVPSHPPTFMVAPNLPITKIVNAVDDAGSDSVTVNTQWSEMCYWQQDNHVFARHEFPGVEVVEIASHVRVYPALDIPVEVTVPLASYGEAWYDCGPVGKTTPMIIFSWVE